MNILGCLDRPTRGRYFLDGDDVSRSDRDQLADIRNRKLGFVFQNFNLLRAPPRWKMSSCHCFTGRSATSNAQLREKRGRGARAVGLQGREIIIRASFPAASNSASRSPAR